ncbi:hypothetical protein FDE76_07555 [Clostridium botulinum]|uniref:Uncharacterized protein n=1 Tax=Clostridium botulinum (strain Eklund 17B / Type B) TaxID=935198 RepID=B2TKV1_CLOBB|nr:hypothetical protein [Clostridium sp. ZS1]ACD23633.1 hypothetical protein CLL_A1637 [Clostridium botulinum B str. Eklund 17B (NRP)]MBY6974559.1 hypothetical protein [Clostridium botulinum]MBY6999544.1 hypothetical protein [Clostridium botulinum]MCR1275230.1 hypothetical protein [Clostridium botulinum]NFD70529.1 hypothetical protein [Clostridium botulinum]
MSSNSELVTKGNVLQSKPIPNGALSQSIQNINGKIYYSYVILRLLHMNGLLVRIFGLRDRRKK